MKKITMVLLAFCCCLLTHAQSFVITDKRTTNLETPENILLQPSASKKTVTLKNAVLNCDTLFIGQYLNELKIIGTVTITCNHVTLDPQISSARVRLTTGLLKHGKLAINCTKGNFPQACLFEAAKKVDIITNANEGR